MQQVFKLSLITLALTLAACGSSDDDKVVEEKIITDTETTEQINSEYGPYTTGSTQAPQYAYFDLDTGKALTLTEQEAQDNTEWDIAFKRTGVYLNSHTDNSIAVNFTGNNTDFFDADGKAIVDKFVNATSESELEDYEAVAFASIPADESAFVGDVTEQILADFYNYDTTTHKVTAADDKYYIVQSDNSFSKYRVSELSQDGRAMSAITLEIANQAEGATDFAAAQTLELDLAALCSLNDAVYIDLDTALEVTADDAYDLSLSCTEGGANYALTLTEDATAIQDFTNVFTGIAPEAASHYGFQPNEYTVRAFDQNKWYAYNLQGGHKLWSQFGVYIIKTPTAHYKFQVLSYYDEQGNSGNYSFRADKLSAE